MTGDNTVVLNRQLQPAAGSYVVIPPYSLPCHQFGALPALASVFKGCV